MNDSTWLVSHESAVRLAIFLATFVLMALWELVAPLQALSLNKGCRWINNLLLLVTDSVVLRMALPIAGSGVALFCQKHQVGLFNSANVSVPIAMFCSIVLLDLTLYWQHRIFHWLPWLWRLHQVHHADLDYDVTTGIRFHPFEIVLSMLIKIAAIILLGIPPMAVVVFEVLLNSSALFNHSNIKLPGWLDARIRLVVVTPAMHRVHHSDLWRESNSNFGFFLSFWDRFFRSYLPKPQAGLAGMRIGLDYVRTEAIANNLPALLRMPFTVAPKR
ncbi:sterol desaturase family protein [Halioxenophilus sp. WMMB6]|uniref:sterol desaturase family protein n=1 Tax=Halioxenophilus sp. WMMB6 TaxID=3073815 RepID=UPI00295E4EEA|nr:sterol desaturase family protein [Halioxenophilus sp. WMMB6]